MKKFKKVLALLAVVAIGLGTVGCGSNDKKDANKDMLNTIKEKKTLVLGTSPDFPPFEFIQPDGGKTKVVGADIDLGQKIADDLGVKLEVKEFNFDALIPALQAGKVDILITGMTPTEKRKQAVDFSDVYYKSKNSLIVRNDFKGKLNSIDDLKNLNVGVQKGSTQESNAKENIKIKNVRSLTTVINLVTDLKNGHLDAVLVSDVVAKINAKQIPGIKVIDNINLDIKGSEESSAIAVKKGDNKEFIKKINSTIKTLIDSGEYQKMLDKDIELASQQK